MADVLMYINQGGIDDLTSQTNVLLGYMQELNTIYKGMGSPFTGGLLKNEFYKAIHTPEPFLRKKIIDSANNTNVGGVPIDTNYLYQMMKLPSGSDNFIEKAASINQWLFSTQISSPGRVSVEFLKDNSGNIIIDQTVFDNNVETYYKIYATTDAQKNAWQKVQDALIALNALGQLFPYNNYFRFHEDSVLQQRYGTFEAGSKAAKLMKTL
jgi:hypothetical protein